MTNLTLPWLHCSPQLWRFKGSTWSHERIGSQPIILQRNPWKVHQTYLSAKPFSNAFMMLVFTFFRSLHSVLSSFLLGPEEGMGKRQVSRYTRTLQASDRSAAASQHIILNSSLFPVTNVLESSYKQQELVLLLFLNGSKTSDTDMNFMRQTWMAS